MSLVDKKAKTYIRTRNVNIRKEMRRRKAKEEIKNPFQSICRKKVSNLRHYVKVKVI